MLDDELIIETPERVELHYVLANVGNRFLAAAIDHLIQALLIVIVLALSGAFSDGPLFRGSAVWAAGLPAGLWWRPAYYGTPDARDQAIRDEVLSVRNNVGLIDVSTLRSCSA